MSSTSSQAFKNSQQHQQNTQTQRQQQQERRKENTQKKTHIHVFFSTELTQGMANKVDPNVNTTPAQVIATIAIAFTIVANRQTNENNLCSVFQLLLW